MVEDQKYPRKLYIFLHKNLAGTLTFDGTIYQFSYEETYLKLSDALPLSLSLPLESGNHVGAMGGKQLPPYFFHLLPEGWLLNLAKSLKMPVSDPMDLLSLLVVETIGAVRILTSEKPLKMPHIRLQNESLLLESDPSSTADFVKKHSRCLYCGRSLVIPGINDNYHPHCSSELFGSVKTPRLNIDRNSIREVALLQLEVGESLSGVQEKFSLRHRKDRKTIAAPLSCFVAKPQPIMPELAELASLEAAYMLFARMLDLPVAKSGIIYLVDGTQCFISRRFDISEIGSRIHQEDMAAPLGKYNKYESSHEGIARILIENKSISKDESHRDRLAFLKITLFNFILGNTDGHLKNFALFHMLGDKGASYKLTPFYDIFPSLLYAPRDTDELGLSLSNRKNRFTKKDFEGLARLLQLGPRTVPAFIESFTSAREKLIQALETYEVYHAMQYVVLDLAKRRLAQLDN
ncbi:MAG: type II toxin-antitoxin system HipA family toxin [Proteobacteria bacterium]|nr:type II toxin-antitoxin system HipA family toxin [Pseudomonadota bacterium]